MHPQFNEIIKNFETQNYPLAEKIAINLLNSNPNDYQILKTLGVIYLVQEKNDAAIECLLKCYEFNKNDYDVVNNLSYLFLENQDFHKSTTYSYKAISLDAAQINAYINIAKAFFIKRDYEKSIDYFEKAINIISGIEHLDTFSCIDYFDALLANSQKIKCLEQIRRRQSKNFNSDIFYYLSSLSPNDILETDLKIAEQLIKNANLEKNLIKRTEILISIYFGLAMYFLNSNVKDQNKAENYFYKGNIEINKILRYMPLNEQKRTIQIKKIFSQDINLDIPKDKGKGLIFIVGLPRSGTTLVESMVASYQDVISGGELKIGNILFAKFSTIFDNQKNVFTSQDIEDFGNEYIRRVDFIKGSKSFLIDKLPSNYNNIGIINLALPGAKIIHISRDPWDNAISLFQQRYIKNVPYSSSFFNIGLIVSNYLHIMNYWRINSYYSNVMDVQYEQLVQNESEIGNKIFDFCGFSTGYNPKFRENFFSNTASKNQINKPVHTQSIKKTMFEASKSDFYQALENQNSFWDKN